TAFARNLRRNDFGAGWPNSFFHRARSSEISRSGNSAISTSRAASSTDLRVMGSGRTWHGLLRGLRCLHRSDPIRPDAVNLFRDEWQFQLLAHGAGEKSAH